MNYSSKINVFRVFSETYMQKLYVRGSVHHSTIHKEKSNKMQQCIKLFLFHIYTSSTCFGRHTAHHQEPKTALTASGFSKVEGCWTCSWWTVSGTVFVAPLLLTAAIAAGSSNGVANTVPD
jgi:hypothetical protein